MRLRMLLYCFVVVQVVVVSILAFFCLTTVVQREDLFFREIIFAEKTTNKNQEVDSKPRWEAEYRLDENKNSILKGRADFAQQIISNQEDYIYEYKLEKWFIYNVATDASGAKLSMNQCASLLNHGVLKCVMVGLRSHALKCWADNKDFMPSNAIIYDGSFMYQMAYDWNLRANFRQPLEQYWLPKGVSFDSHRHVQAIILARTFLFLDVLHRGINVWMLDSDVVFPIDPRGIFLNDQYDCVYMMNVGDYTQAVRHEYPYSYPFLPGGRHATINNGIVASRATSSSQKLWQKSIDRVLNHIHGDPQHPHNQLLFLYGVTLKKNNINGYADLGADLGYYTGEAVLPIGEDDKLSLNILAVSTASGYNRAQAGNKDDILLQQVAIHAVGIGGMYANQVQKCNYFKSIGFWHLEVSCD